MLSGNKGEWSEVYTLLKIISDKRLFAGDEFQNRINDLIYPIIKVIRHEADRKIEYSYEVKEINSVVISFSNSEETYKISIKEFENTSKILLSEIQNLKNKSAFQIQEITDFLNSIYCTKIKASSISKSDLNIVIHDQFTGSTPNLGFSIKSQIGSPSTLLNAGGTTNFIYRLPSYPQDIPLNQPDKVKKLVTFLKKITEIEFVGLQNKIFENNLTLIDSLLPKIIAQALLVYYDDKGVSDLKTIVEQLQSDNPLGYDKSHTHQYYSYKVKRFLTDIALGMMPSQKWDGTFDATGGYLVVKNDGEVLCYHVYNRNHFEDYLLANTKLETASTSRHGFGQVYKEGSSFYVKLNLQIRFKR